MTSRVVVRADATEAMGTGHVMRCLAVAEALADDGCPVAFAAAALTPALERWLADAGFDVVLLPGPAGGAEDCAATLAAGNGPILIDGYHFGATYRAELRNAGRRVAAFDDLADCPALHADLVINSGLQADARCYDRIAPQARQLLGPVYAPLRREIRDAARQEPRPMERRRSVLVSFGGSDPLGLTGSCVAALTDRLPATAKIDVVVGGSNPKAAALAQQSWDGRVTVHIDTRRMGALMAGAGLAISAAGGTTAELAAMAVPTLLVVVADNQIPAARELEARGLCAVAQATPEAIAAQALILWHDDARRAAMAAAVRRMVDGEGAIRIARAILAL